MDKSYCYLSFAVLFGFFCSIVAAVAEDDLIIEGELEWPGQWRVFADMVRADEVLPAEILATIPDEIHVPAIAELPDRVITGVDWEVLPGYTFDLHPEFFPEQARDNVAYVFLELNSPRDQRVTFGIGADYWLQVWINGEEVFDTLRRGNVAGPVGMLNQSFTAGLREGKNVMAIRLITGRGTSQLGVGGPSEFAGARVRHAKWLHDRRLNELPERFEDRQVFPVETQAIATASMDLDFLPVPEDLADGVIVGLEEMPMRQLMFRPRGASRGELVDTNERRFRDPVKMRLSKYEYPWEDGHMDVILYTTSPHEGVAPTGSVELLLKGEDGEVLVRHTLDSLSPNGLFFSLGIPEALRGRSGSLEAVWQRNGRVVGKAEMPFVVTAGNDYARSGRIPIRLLNESGATISSAPFSLGVPFPLGVLRDPDRVRLVDERGGEIPLQTRETGRWSRLGPIKWLLCDFTADLDGEGRTVYLEYGPSIHRTPAAPLAAQAETAGFPDIDAGRIRVDRNGLAVDLSGDGTFAPVLSREALSGAFVKHENGIRFAVPEGVEHVIEEDGSEKIVVRRTGWYVDPDSDEEFCQFITRFVFTRDSPVLRIFHTWIFTGDGNADRISDMGWRFPSASALVPDGVLADWNGNRWLQANNIVQFDFASYLDPATGAVSEGRLPGVLSGRVGDVRVAFGAKDFWQNFPSELEVDAKGFTFYNWPLNNPPATLERPIAEQDAFRSRFIHEGKVLDFRIPDEYATGPIFEVSSARERHIDRDRPESVNAQGISRTEEMFLYFSPAAAPLEGAAMVLNGLNYETLRAVVDPAWLTATRVFGRIHPRDRENFPEEEYLIDLIHSAPGRWVERLGVYGMWLHGDYPTWNLNLEQQTVSVYRTLRKNHHTYPYRWVPYARSGEPWKLKFAEAATRQMIDANFCHFATPEIDAIVGPSHFRRQGWWDRSLLPYAGRVGPIRRSYTIETDYLWQAYHLTGYARARDLLLLLAKLYPEDHNVATGPRATSSMLSSYLDMYAGMFDPWFLAASYEISDLYDHLYGDIEEVDPYTFSEGYDYAGHGWRGEQQKLYYFTGHPEHRRLAINNAMALTSPPRTGSRLVGTAGGAGGAPAHLASFLWNETGDRFYLARAAAAWDSVKTSIYDGEIEHFRGAIVPIGHGYVPLRNNRWDAAFMALAVLGDSDDLPDPIHNPFFISGSGVNRDDEENFNFVLPTSYVYKGAGEEVRLNLDARGRPDQIYDVRMTHLQTGTEFHEQWQPPANVFIREDQPAGTYQIELFGSVPYGEESDHARFRRRTGNVFFPLSENSVKEVITFPTRPSGTAVTAGGQGYWFFVPEGVEEFWIEFHGQANRPTQRVSVWSPNGERIVDEYTGGDGARFSIPMSANQAGQMWRATGGSFVIDPAIPPYFSVAQRKWFDPQLAETDGE